MKKLSKFTIALIVVFIIYVLGMLTPRGFTMPVLGANCKSYNQDSFWYFPWGRSGRHKGVDVFAKEGVPVVAATKGLVIYTGNIEMGGNVVLVLGPKWQLYYYAHLKHIGVSSYRFVKSGDKIGSVGATGNAKGKAPHLHFSIKNIIPQIKKIEYLKKGFERCFYEDPTPLLNKACK